MNDKKIIAKNREETFDLGFSWAEKIQDGGILCLTGDLGSGKTTFSQGLLKGLGVEETVNSPTFVVMKNYSVGNKNIYHIDTYRMESENDIIDLGWEEIISNEKNIVIIEWPEKIKKIIPKKAIRIDFKWLGENEREIIFQ